MLVVVGLASLVAILGAQRIRVDADFLYYFGRGSEVRIAADTINERITGTSPFYVIIDSETPDLLRRWEVLKMVKDLQTFLGTLPGVTSSISFVDYLELLEAGLAKGSEGDLLVDEQGNIMAAEKPKSFWEEPRNLEPLFEAILGRFDAGIIVSEPRRRSLTPDRAGSFLGFEVTDIELFRLERAKSSQLARERLARFGARGALEARAG